MQQYMGTAVGQPSMEHAALQPSMFHASKPGAGVQEYTGVDAWGAWSLLRRGS